jgi:cytochrome c oxidase cbb3-type subunit 3
MSTNDPLNEKHADGIVEDRKKAPPVYFYILFYGLIAWAVIFMAWFLLSGWSSHEEFAEKMAAHTGVTVAETPELSGAETGAVVDGGELFAERCAGCHGAKGEGAFGPDLTASRYKYGREREEVIESITKGRPKSMPAFSATLSAAEIQALTSYVLEL